MNKNNSLQQHYRINTHNQLVVNQKTALNGTWRLTDAHELCLTLDATKDSQSGQTIVFGGIIKSVSLNILVFSVSRHDDVALHKTYTLKLGGTWQADSYNRLRFEVRKKQSRHDILTFKNQWTVNKHHHLVYRYETAQTQEIKFKGYWNLTKDRRLYYQLGNSSHSGFKFSIGTAFFERNKIQYKISIGKNRQSVPVTINGFWRITSDLKITFEVDYGETGVKAIILGGQWDLGDDTSIRVRFSDGVEIKLARKWLKGDCNAFIQYYQDRQDAGIKLGVEFIRY